jgi:hypothetical protein
MKKLKQKIKILYTSPLLFNHYHVLFNFTGKFSLQNYIFHIVLFNQIYIYQQYYIAKVFSAQNTLAL